jgi:hypothetical protein
LGVSQTADRARSEWLYCQEVERQELTPRDAKEYLRTKRNESERLSILKIHSNWKVSHSISCASIPWKGTLIRQAPFIQQQRVRKRR